MKPLFRNFTVAAIVVAASLVTAARAFNTGDIVVDSVKGEARLTQAGKERDARRGQVVLVPASLRTGRDGAVDLRQGATLVNVGPDTVLDFPAAQERGSPVERIVQSRGNAFYDVGKRDGRKLRVETPYLVAVIKGTQFSVSVQDGLTSISLVEGSLEILTPDGGATVDLSAGEVATRRQGDAGITVVDIGAAQVRGPGAGAAGVVATVAGQDVQPGVAAGVGGIVADVARTPAGAGVALDVNVGRGTLETATAVSVAAGSVEVAAGVSTGQGATVDLAASADVAGATTVEVAASADLGAAGVGIDAGAGVDLGAGAVTADAGASVDLGQGALGTDVDAGLSADLGGASGSPATVEVGVDAGVAGVDAGVSAGVDLGASAVDIGVDLGVVDVDVGLDLGLDDDTTEDTTTQDAGTDTQDGGGIVEDVGGLLDGLLRRPGRP